MSGYRIPVIRNNSYPFTDVEIEIEDDGTLSIDDPHTVMLSISPTEEELLKHINEDIEPDVYVTVDTKELIKALQWLERRA